MSLSVINLIEAWWLSLRDVLESAGVVGRFERSPSDRLNPSCNLNLRREESEADLMVWESREAELSVVKPDGSVSQQHFENIGQQPDFGIVLSQLVALASDTESK